MPAVYLLVPQTPLLMAVVKCKAGLAERLVQRGADPNIADKQGDVPLHAALRNTGAHAPSLWPCPRPALRPHGQDSNRVTCTQMRVRFCSVCI